MPAGAVLSKCQLCRWEKKVPHSGDFRSPEEILGKSDKQEEGGRGPEVAHCFFFLAALGLCCCMRAFSGEWGLLFVVVHGLLIVVASLSVEHRL